MRRKWIIGALLCALAPVGVRAEGESAQVDLARRADGVFVLTNNPDRPRPPMVGMVGAPPAGSRRYGQATVAPFALRARINDHAMARDLDPKLVEALIRVESAFNARALSHKGAMGLMQLMPGTASELGVENAFDIEENLRGGTAYLRSLLDRFSGDISLALAGYNAGPGAVEKYGGIPPYRETTDYVRRVLAAYGTAPAAKSARPPSTSRAIIRVASSPAAVAAPARVATGAGR